MAQTAVTDLLAESFVIEGGHPLSGRIRAAGNKNAALPILAACLLTSEPVLLHNVPRIHDVETMMALIAGLGAETEWVGANEVRVHAADVSSYELDAELASRIRASFLLAGPLLARVGRASVPPPGGDVIGRRRLDPARPWRDGHGHEKAGHGLAAHLCQTCARGPSGLARPGAGDLSAPG
jgi:UDP-N-acetylglucosamine enolpyruvyl transferase